MTKTGLMLTSLVAAIPGAFLAFLLVRGFLNSAENMVTTMYIINGLTLAASALMAVMPVGVMLFFDRAQEAAAAAPANAAPERQTVTDDDDEDGFADASSDEDSGDVGEIGGADDFDAFDEFEEEDDDEEEW